MNNKTDKSLLKFPVERDFEDEFDNNNQNQNNSNNLENRLNLILENRKSILSQLRYELE